MEDFIEIVFDWIGENENVLSGMVAIAVLIGLVVTGVRGSCYDRKPAY